VSGSKTFTIIPHRATLFQGGGISSDTIAAMQDDPSPMFVSCASTVTVRPELVGKALLVLAPNQQHMPGSGNGKDTLATSTQTAGVPLT